MSSMLSIWRAGADQLTPKPSTHLGTPHERNPFDQIAADAIGGSRFQTTSFASTIAGGSMDSSGQDQGQRTPTPRSPTSTTMVGLAAAGGMEEAPFSVQPAPSSEEAAASAPRQGAGHRLKAAQTTSVSKATPDFHFAASALSRAKNALRDSVSGGAGKTGKAKEAAPSSSRVAGGGAVEPTVGSPPEATTSSIISTPRATSPLAASPTVPPALKSPTMLANETPVPGPTHANGSNKAAAVFTAPLRGTLSVKLVSGRNISAPPTARPYVVAQFDNNEFVSREPIGEEELEVRGVAAKRGRTDSTIGTEGKGPPPPAGGEGRGNQAQSKEDRGKEVAGPSRGETSGSSRSLESQKESNGIGEYCLTGTNPIWKHEVDFDVANLVSEKLKDLEAQGGHSAFNLLVSVYDRSVGDNEEGGVEGLETFLGETEIRLDFQMLKSREGWYDSWYTLSSKSDDSITGDIRIQLKYKETKSTRRLATTDFDFIRMIGKGTFGRVFQVRKKDTKRIYAMKVLNKKEVIAKKEVAHTIGERNILQRSSECPFLLGLKFSFQSPNELFLVMDYKSGGELFHHLQKEGRFSEERARFYTAEIVLAFEHLHKYNIVYRDLKPENILLDATGHIVLCDFGLSKPDLPTDALTTTFCGTTEYLAPEVLLDDHGYSKLVDFWSLGVLLFEMCCGWSPFYAEDTQQMYKNICFGKIKFPRGVIGDDGKLFVKGLLNRNPRHRLGAQRDAQDLKEHAFFKSIDFIALEKREITPPFKPFVDSDESVANFDPEFTEADILKEMPMPSFDEDDPSADWIDQASVSNGNAFPARPAPINGRRRRSEDSMNEPFRGFSYVGESEILFSAKFGMTSLDG